MPERDIYQTTYTGLRTAAEEFSVSSESIDESQGKEHFYNNDDFYENLGYYKKIPELKQAIDALARWTAGKGWTTTLTKDGKILSNIVGWGEDTFDSLMQSMVIMKKVNGDSYAEIIRNEEGMLINLKPLNPGRMRIVTNQKGTIKRYDELGVGDKVKRTFEPKDIFHLCENRIANENHGTSVIESCKWVIDARNEAMDTWRRMLHRSGVRLAYIDMDDSATLTKFQDTYEQAIKYGEVMIMPGKKGDMELVDFPVSPSQPYLETIRYYENFFYQAVGVPKVILGGAADYTEASSKVGYLTFEQVYMTEQRLLEQDIWNQLAIKIKFERPVSLKDNVQGSEAANTGQAGFQPNETKVGVTRNE